MMSIIWFYFDQSLHAVNMISVKWSQVKKKLFLPHRPNEAYTGNKYNGVGMTNVSHIKCKQKQYKTDLLLSLSIRLGFISPFLIIPLKHDITPSQLRSALSLMTSCGSNQDSLGITAVRYSTQEGVILSLCY